MMTAERTARALLAVLATAALAAAFGGCDVVLGLDGLEIGAPAAGGSGGQGGMGGDGVGGRGGGPPGPGPGGGGSEPGTVRLAGAFESGAFDAANGNLRLRGRFAWHAQIRGRQGTIELEGWLR